MSYSTPEDRIRDGQVRRLSTGQDPRGRQHRKDVYRVDLKPKKAKPRDCKEEESAPQDADLRTGQRLRTSQIPPPERYITLPAKGKNCTSVACPIVVEVDGDDR